MAWFPEQENSMPVFISHKQIIMKKTAKHQYFFEVKLSSREDRKGILTAMDVNDEITVATAPGFAGGIPGIWSPEHLFLCSLSSCFMTTYYAIAAKRRLAIAGFECTAIGQVQLVAGHLAFTTINLFPKVFVQIKEDIQTANEVLLRTGKHCIIANSVTSHLVHHGEVLVKEQTHTFTA